MDFHQYYKNKMSEAEGDFMKEPLDVDAPVVERPQVAQPVQATNTNILASYVATEKSMKTALSKLGTDLSTAIVNYAKEQAVNVSNFESEQAYDDYKKKIRSTVEEKYNVTLIELLKQIGIFIDNTINSDAN